MKKIALVLIFCLLLSSCSAGRHDPLYRVVTGIRVQYQQQNDTLSRTYTKPASIQSILTYLRFLKPFGPVLPQGEQDANCQFTLQYSHGPDSVYQQRGNEYLRRDGGDWQTINTSYGSLLYPLLLLLPSD